MGSGQQMKPVLPGWRHVYSGKVRDLYVPDRDGGQEAQAGEAAGSTDDVVLVVASDRISAYDHILSTPIPDKGRILTALSLWWFEQLADVVANHVVSTEVPSAVAGRAMICHRLDMLPIECVARGYLSGSGWEEYRRTQAVTGIHLPAGLRESDQLPEPIFTPATKAEIGEHDENIDLDQAKRIVGPEQAEAARDLTLTVYSRAAALAGQAGIILADTKFEFGVLPQGAAGGRGSAGEQSPGSAGLILGDEVLTPDSSRFWPAEDWEPGRPQASYDKQFVRDWLTSPDANWDRAADAPPPPLPAEIVERTRDRYVQAFERLTGEQFA
ncbi:phosphoribosylaminoimidazolesuccinocarboxamide synthase [Bogoriella caseilytica]|uniref:Phosphoribosylaminoimidazole-succinocarboxamide synthase n=1 Tax=Bogoriella caseilytica TaxID=56055 RepID=A0A3N2BBD4_9MICO|nr:phosphoribosylaminoimidazolesuccinocarboxamide synthase [Bogoriella caseilytica]ROR72555.1 phosphoribosylaminoimidazole-succinocarboxamide synthase [Bogoriella caseilytica]